MDAMKKILQAKIDARYFSRELIRVVFQATEQFPSNDPDQIGAALRKKTLAISSFLSHGTVKSDRSEQNEDFLVVMAELREVLKLVTIAHHLRYISNEQKVSVRIGISKLIEALDKLVVILGGFDKK